jgi:hypothetical protein
MALTQVETSGLSGSGASSNSTTGNVFSQTGPFKNRIINGDMRIDQRNAGASVTINGNFLYPVDRVHVGGVPSGGTFTAQRSTTAPSGFTNSLVCTVSTADTSLASGDYYFPFLQNVEGFNSADLGWGTASAQSITVSFWCRSSAAGTYAVAVRNDAANRSFIRTFSISSANAWEYKSVLIPGDATGTWLTDNSSGIRLSIGAIGGSSVQGSADAWTGSNVYTTSGCVNWMATSAATFYITGVQLEAGTIATPFERRSYGQELALCQRYAYVNQQGDTGRAETTAKTNNSVKFPVTMRTAPSAAVLGTLKYRDNSGTTTRTASSPSAPVVSPSTPDGAYYELTASSWSPSNFTIGNLTHICCDAGANGILFSSEL